MMPNMMGNVNLPSVKELWKDEKGKYRHWVIILAIGLIAILALSIISYIYNLIGRDEIVEKNAIAIDGTYVKIDIIEAREIADSNFVKNNIIFPTIISLALLGGTIWFFVSIFTVYKQKNFARLSGWPTLIIGLGALMSFIQLMTMAFSSDARATLFKTPGSVFAFVTKILYITIYFAASSPVSRLRRTFLMSERMEKIKNDPQYQHLAQQMQGMMQGGMANPGAAANDPLKGGKMPNGPFGPVMGSPNTTPPATPQEETITPAQKEEMDKTNRLKGLSVEKLKKVAKELSISGFDKMKKDELIESILRVSNGGNI